MKSVVSFLFIMCITNLVLSVSVLKNNNRNPMLIISLDGLRADKLDEFLNENPNSLIQKEFVDNGAKAKYMQPIFPSNTFPNHYTLVTGLVSESHGIIGNSFYDPDYNETVNLIRDSKANELKWWNATEPLWATAKKQNLKTGSFFWVASEVWPNTPDIFVPYNDQITFIERCNEVVMWFKKFEVDLALLYFDQPDSTGHKYGPNSSEYKNKIKEMNEIIEYLIKNLKSEGVYEKLNIMIVSDHGMAQMFPSFVVTDYINESLIDFNKSIFGTVSNIYPIDESKKEPLYESLKNISTNLKVYYKNDIPLEFQHFKSRRIAPIIVIGDEGYSLDARKYPTPYNGNHGFNNSIVSMRSVFLARGPNFKKNVKIESLRSVDVYPLACNLLNIKCHKNNGTIEVFNDALEFNNGSSKIKNNFFTLFLFFLILMSVKNILS